MQQRLNLAPFVTEGHLSPKVGADGTASRHIATIRRAAAFRSSGTLKHDKHLYMLGEASAKVVALSCRWCARTPRR